MTRNFLSLVTFDVKAGFTQSDKIGFEVGIKDMPNIYKLTLCLWTKFLQPPKDVVHPISFVVSYESQKQEGFLLWFDTSAGHFIVRPEERSAEPDDE